MPENTDEPFRLFHKHERGPEPPHRHHGKPSSWLLVAVMISAFAAGGTSLILGSWLIFFVCAGVFVLCVPIGWAIGIMDDTIAWTLPWSEARRLDETEPTTEEPPTIATEQATPPHEEVDADRGGA
jgi:hypothetical protein